MQLHDQWRKRHKTFIIRIINGHLCDFISVMKLRVEAWIVNDVADHRADV